MRIMTGPLGQDDDELGEDEGFLYQDVWQLGDNISVRYAVR